MGVDGIIVSTFKTVMNNIPVLLLLLQYPIILYFVQYALYDIESKKMIIPLWISAIAGAVVKVGGAFNEKATAFAVLTLLFYMLSLLPRPKANIKKLQVVLARFPAVIGIEFISVVTWAVSGDPLGLFVVTLMWGWIFPWWLAISIAGYSMVKDRVIGKVEDFSEVLVP